MVKIGNIYKIKGNSPLDFPRLIEIISKYDHSEYLGYDGYYCKILKQGKTIVTSPTYLPKSRIENTYEYDNFYTLQNKLNILINANC